MENWKPVVGFEDCYSVSDLGRVARTSLTRKRTKPIWRLLAKRPNKFGYIKYHLCKDDIRYDKTAHILVWTAFKGQIQEGAQINHINGNKADNRLSNLEVCTRSQNMIHAYRVLKIPAPNNPSFGSKNGSAKLSESQVAEILSLYASGKYRQKDLGKKFGVSQRMISLITRREKWQHVSAATPISH